MRPGLIIVNNSRWSPPAPTVQLFKRLIDRLGVACFQVVGVMDSDRIRHGLLMMSDSNMAATELTSFGGSRK